MKAQGPVYLGQSVVTNVALVHAAFRSPLLKNLSLLINKKDNKKAIFKKFIEV